MTDQHTDRQTDVQTDMEMEKRPVNHYEEDKK